MAGTREKYKRHTRHSPWPGQRATVRIGASGAGVLRDGEYRTIGPDQETCDGLAFSRGDRRPVVWRTSGGPSRTHTTGARFPRTQSRGADDPADGAHRPGASIPRALMGNS